ncbi:hypothetical protein I6F34_01340 [Bradyrhizobium sp. BRP05]|nr:hypothetical protein [Bradyrhizobium sp. BRP05]
MSEPTVYPTIQFVAVNHPDAPWLRMTFPGLDDEELENLSNHLGEKLGWFTWFHTMPDPPAQEGGP